MSLVEGPKMPQITRITIENKNKLGYHPSKGEHSFLEKDQSKII